MVNAHSLVVSLRSLHLRLQRLDLLISHSRDALGDIIRLRLNVDDHASMTWGGVVPEHGEEVGQTRVHHLRHRRVTSVLYWRWVTVNTYPAVLEGAVIFQRVDDTDALLAPNVENSGGLGDMQCLARKSV